MNEIHRLENLLLKLNRLFNIKQGGSTSIFDQAHRKRIIETQSKKVLSEKDLFYNISNRIFKELKTNEIWKKIIEDLKTDQEEKSFTILISKDFSSVLFRQNKVETKHCYILSSNVYPLDYITDRFVINLHTHPDICYQDIPYVIYNNAIPSHTDIETTINATIGYTKNKKQYTPVYEAILSNDALCVYFCHRDLIDLINENIKDKDEIIDVLKTNTNMSSVEEHTSDSLVGKYKNLLNPDGSKDKTDIGMFYKLLDE
jgi:hypothetical protein